MKILPSDNVGSHKQASLTGVTYDEIVAKLGFPLNVDDDAGKVR